jgi:hypothetical protein
MYGQVGWDLKICWVKYWHHKSPYLRWNFFEYKKAGWPMPVAQENAQEAKLVNFGKTKGKKT